MYDWLFKGKEICVTVLPSSSLARVCSGAYVEVAGEKQKLQNRASSVLGLISASNNGWKVQTFLLFGEYI